jgi:REP-associated tyrosine transposase
MARIKRIVVPGYPHHVVQRGVRSMDIFFQEQDRKEYLMLLREQAERFGVTFLSYCLMTNHVHLLVVPEKPDSLDGRGRTTATDCLYIKSYLKTPHSCP